MKHPMDPVQVGEVWLLGDQRLGGVHLRSECQFTCVLHNPTEHSMRGLPLIWRSDRGIYERVCPHGIGHPDPDQEEYWRAMRGDEWADAQGIHGCDGCCYEEDSNGI